MRFLVDVACAREYQHNRSTHIEPSIRCFNYLVEGESVDFIKPLK